MFLSQDTIFLSGSVTLVSIVTSGKKLPGNPKLPKVSTYNIQYVCKIENLKVGSMRTAHPTDSRKAFCEVCNNAIIAKH